MKISLDRVVSYLYASALNRIRAVLSRVMERRVYTARSGFTKGLKTRGGFAFLPLRGGLTYEHRFLLGLDLDGKIIFDIGGGSGAFTLVFARAVGKRGRVFVFEPNPHNRQVINDRLQINAVTNVHLISLGIADGPAKDLLVFSRQNTGTGSIDPGIREDLLQREGMASLEIEIDSIDGLIEAGRLQRPDFLKIDVEGAELAVLVGMERTLGLSRPTLFIEMHGVGADAKARNARAVTEYLCNNRYLLYHVESMRIVDLASSEIASEGHLYCTPSGDRPDPSES